MASNIFKDATYKQEQWQHNRALKHQELKQEIATRGISVASIQQTRLAFERIPTTTSYIFQPKEYDCKPGYGVHLICIPIPETTALECRKIGEEIALKLPSLDIYLNTSESLHLTVFHTSRPNKHLRTSAAIREKEIQLWRSLVQDFEPFELMLEAICLTSSGTIIALLNGCSRVNGSYDTAFTIDYLRERARSTFPESPTSQTQNRNIITIGRILGHKAECQDAAEKHYNRVIQESEVQSYLNQELSIPSFWVKKLSYIHEKYQLSASGEAKTHDLEETHNIIETILAMVKEDREKDQSTYTELRTLLQTIERGESTNERDLRQLTRQLDPKVKEQPVETQDDQDSTIHRILNSNSTKSIYQIIKRKHQQLKPKEPPSLSRPISKRPHVKKRKRQKNHLPTMPKSNQPTIPMLNALDQQKGQKRLIQSQKQVLVQEKKMQHELNQAQRIIPLKFMFEKNLAGFCQEKGVEIIQTTFNRLVYNFLDQAIERWKKFVHVCREIERQKSVALLVRIYRGHLGRQKAKTIAAKRTKIAEKERKFVEFRVLFRKTQAVRIQMFFRRLLVYRATQQKKKRVDAAVLIQKMYRLANARVMELTEMLAEAKRIRAAIRIQKRVRGINGRKRFREIRTEVYQAKKAKKLFDRDLVIATTFETYGAAFRIQRCFRRWLGRKRGKLFREQLVLDRAALRIQHSVRAYVARISFRLFLHQLRLDAPLRVAAALVIQRCARGAICRWSFRSWLANEKRRKREARLEAKRKAMQRRRFHKPVVSKRGLKAAFGVKIQQVDDLNYDATILQAFWRGVLGRRKAKERKMEVLEEKKAAEEMRRSKAATVIQRRCRGIIGRRMARDQYYFVHATQIQKQWKRYIGQKKYKRMLELHRAAKVIQKKYRANFSKGLRRYLKRQRELERRSAAVIQNVVRQYLSRMWILYEREWFRYSEELQLAHEAYFDACTRRAQDWLLLQSIEGMLEDGWPIKSSVTYDPTCTFFPAFQNIFINATGNKVIHSTKTTADDLEKLELERAKFTKLFRDVPGLVGSILSPHQIDLVFAKFKKTSSKLFNLTFNDFGEAIRDIASMAFPKVLQWNKYTGTDAQLLHFTYNYLFQAKTAAEIASNLRKYTELWMHHCVVKLQCASRVRNARRAAARVQQANAAAWQAWFEWQAATKIQQRYRMRLARRNLTEIMKSVFRKYIDVDSGLPYWVNPRTGYSTWEKPACFGDDDVKHQAIPMPDPDLNYTVICSNCNVSSVRAWCHQCDDFFCDYCNSSLHAKGNNASHKIIQIHVCDLCEFQMGTVHCRDCDEYLCDCCSKHNHSQGSMLVHRIDPVVKKCTCEQAYSVRNICTSCNVGFCNKCFHEHPSETCYTEVLGATTLEIEEYLEMLKKEQEEDPVNIALAKEEKRKNGAALLIQRNWRRRKACRDIFKNIKELKRQRQEVFKKKQRDSKKKKSLFYSAKNVLGVAEALELDTKEDIRLKKMSFIARKKLEKRAKSFHMDVRDLIRTGIPMPGTISIAQGKDVAETTTDLRQLVKPGANVRIEGKIYKVHPKNKVNSKSFTLTEPFDQSAVEDVKVYLVEVLPEDSNAEAMDESHDLPQNSICSIKEKTEENEITTEDKIEDQTTEAAPFDDPTEQHVGPNADSFETNPTIEDQQVQYSYPQDEYEQPANTDSHYADAYPVDPNQEEGYQYYDGNIGQNEQVHEAQYENTYEDPYNIGSVEYGAETYDTSYEQANAEEYPEVDNRAAYESYEQTTTAVHYQEDANDRIYGSYGQQNADEYMHVNDDSLVYEQANAEQFQENAGVEEYDAAQYETNETAGEYYVDEANMANPENYDAGDVQQYADANAVNENNYEDGIGLPANWQECYDEASGFTYYYNYVTGESSWEYPAS